MRIVGVILITVAVLAVIGLLGLLAALGALSMVIRHRAISIICAVALAILLLGIVMANARDRGQFAQSTPEMKRWFDTLKSGKGLCCSDADGTAVLDADWRSKGGRYQVRVDGDWHDVPEDAVITERNRVGRTMVWPLRGSLGLTIRCFMPGSMS
jgi:hypothetical protein